MNYTTELNKQTPNGKIIGSLDHANPQEQMRAIGTALQQYFEVMDWLKERDRRQAWGQCPKAPSGASLSSSA